MVFANPLLLFGLFALSIPILIHLFNFRRYRKVYFTNVRFLTAIKQETRKRSEIRQLLILLSRLLAIACLVLAFAQPYIPSPLQQRKRSGQKAVSIYIDNSFSMESLAGEGSLLDVAKNRAIEIAGACAPSDQFLLVTNDAGGRYNTPVSREEFVEMVRDVSLSPVSLPMTTILLRQKEALGRVPASDRTIYLISDFQRSSADLSLFQADTANSYILVPLHPGKRNNLYIDSAWFESPVQQPGEASVLKVLVKNAGDEPVEKVPLRLVIKNRQKAVSGVALGAGASAEVSLPFTNDANGLQQGKVEITDYPVVFDNTVYFSYPLLRSVPVLSINGNAENPWLDALFRDDSTFSFSDVPASRLDYSSLQRYSIIILNGLREISSGLAQELDRYITAGGHLVLFPAGIIDAGSYKNFTDGLSLPAFGRADTSKRRVDNVNLESMLFSDVFEKDASGRVILPENTDLPTVFLHYQIDVQNITNTESLLRLENGDPFLNSFSRNNGTIYLFTSPLEPAATNFPKHPLFVPVLYKMAILSKTRQKLYYTAGSNDPVVVTGDTLTSRTTYKVKKENSSFEVIPEIRNTGSAILLFPRDQVRDAGHYLVERDGEVVSGISFNYHRAESDPALWGAAEITSALRKDGIRYFAILKDNKTPVSRQVKEFEQGKPLWKIFIILALVFLATEIAIIRTIR